jgi:uncharacterized protein (TIGR02246 family)
MSNRFLERRMRLTSVQRNPAEYEAASRDAILDLMRRMERAWAVGDAASFVAAFAADCDFVSPDGTHLRGRDAKARRQQALFDSVLRGTRLVFDEAPAIRFLAENVALVHAMAAVLLPWQRRVRRGRRSKQTLVAVRGPQGWRFTAFHGTRYRPEPPPTGWSLKLKLVLLRIRAALARKRRRGTSRCDSVLRSRR